MKTLVLTFLFAFVSANWRFPYKDPAHTSFVSLSIDSKVVPWTRDLHGGAYTTSIGDDGTIYTATKSSLVAISPQNETVWSYDASGGESHSGIVTSNFGNGPICIDNGRIFLLSANFSTDSVFWAIHAVDQSSGQRIWFHYFSIETYGAATLMIGSTGTVYLNMMTQSQEMFAFDPSNGNILWSKGWQQPFLYALENPIDGYLILCGGAYALALDPNGETAWKQNYSIYFNGAIDENGIGYAPSNTLKAFNASTGEIIWETEVGKYSGAWWVPLTVKNGKIYWSYFYPGSGILNQSNIAAFESSSGKLLWNTTTCIDCGYSTGSCNVAVTEDYAITGSGNNVIALDPETGKQVWSYNLGDQVSATNIYVVENTITNTQTIYATLMGNENLNFDISMVAIPFQV